MSEQPKRTETVEEYLQRGGTITRLPDSPNSFYGTIDDTTTTVKPRSDNRNVQELQRVSWKDIEQFQTWLRAAGYNVYIRRSRGDKEAAACGQLAGDFVDRTSRRRRLIKIHAQGAG